MAREDRSPVVRLYLASALQRLDPPVALERRRRAAGPRRRRRRSQPAEDALVWRRAARRRESGLALDRAGNGRIPLVAQFVARRAVDADALEPVVAAIGAAHRQGLQASLLEGLRDGLEGRVDLAPPSNWASTLARLKRSPDTRITRLAAEVTEQFGDAETAGRNLTAVRTRTVAVDDRRRALRTLAAQRRPELVPELASALDEPPLRVDAIRAIAAYDDEGLGKLLIARFQTFNSTEKYEAVQTLASRGRYGRMLTEALASGGISKTDVPPNVARQLRRVVGVRFAEVWGPVEQTAQSATEERAYARYRGLLNDSDAQQRERRQRARALPAHLRRLPQDVRRGRRDWARPHGVESR